MITRSESVKQEFPWGWLEWYVSGAQDSEAKMTFGRCFLLAFQENMRHIHPNCDEVLHVISGEIVHSIGDETFEMRPGDTISIPAGIPHNARSVSDEMAVLAIAFSSPDRLSIPEKPRE